MLSTPFIRKVMDLFKQIVYLPGDTYERGFWSRIWTKSRGISWSNTTHEISRWQNNFSSCKNYFDVSTIPVVPFLLTQSIYLTLSWWRPISYRNLSTGLRSKSMDWFLYDIGLRPERVKLKMMIIFFQKIRFICFNYTCND